MSIVNTGSAWQVSVSVNGRRCRRSFPTKEAAEMWEAETRVALLKGQVPSGYEGSAPASLAELADTVYRQVWAGTRGEATADINAAAVVSIIGGSRDPDSITMADVDRVVDALRAKGNSPATINRKLAALSRMLSFAHARGWVSRKIPITRMREPQGRIRFLSRDEYSDITADFQANDPEMADLFVVLVETGMRLNEALLLQWRDVENGHIRIWQNKADKPRSIPMSTACRHALKNCDSKAYPFMDLTTHTVRHRWNAMKKRLGYQDDLQLTPHCCRHTFASWLVQRGIPIYTVKELCGHKCIEVTMRYAHLKDEDRSNAISSVFG